MTMGNTANTDMFVRQYRKLTLETNKHEICLKYLLDKNSIKQPQCVVGYSHRQSKSESKGEQHVRSILWPLSAEKALQKNDLAAKSTAWEQNTAQPQLSYEL